MLKKKNIAIVDADFGNIGSVINATKYLGYEFALVKNPINLESYSHLILPGVGSYNKAAKKLKSLGWYEAIKNFASSKKPVLGICLGMQLMFEEGDEHGTIEGLKFFKGKCTEFSNNDKLAEDLLAGSESSGEHFWRMPLTGALKEQLKSDVADMKNTGFPSSTHRFATAAARCVLPEPDGPATATKAPFFRDRSTPRRA